MKGFQLLNNITKFENAKIFGGEGNLNLILVNELVLE